MSDFVKSYRVCHGDTFGEFQAKMDGFIEAGFQPYGQPFVWEQSLCQAMVYCPTESAD